MENLENMYTLERIGDEKFAHIVLINGKRSGRFISGVYYPETNAKRCDTPAISSILMKFLIEQYTNELASLYSMV